MSKQHQHFNVWRITCEDRSRSWSWRRSQSQERHLSALSGSLQSWDWGSFGSPISLFKAHRLTDLFIKHLTRAIFCIIEGLAVFNNLSQLTAIQCFTLLNLCVCVCWTNTDAVSWARGIYLCVPSRHLTHRWRRQSRNPRVTDPMLMSLDHGEGK